MLKIKKSTFKTGYNNNSNKPDKKRFRNNLVSSFIRKLKYKERKSFERKRQQFQKIEISHEEIKKILLNNIKNIVKIKSLYGKINFL